MLLVPIPLTLRTWALPFLTVLATSQRYHRTRHAQLFQPAPPRHPQQMRRPHKVGKRLAGLHSQLNAPKTRWQSGRMSDWSGRGDYELDITSATALWDKTGMPAVPIRWVLIRAPKGQLEPQSLLNNDMTAQPEEILV